jgi:predicted RNA-binding protein with PUA-like domain
MAFWLFKSEPSSWSWEQQLQRGAAGEPWSGVRNFQAANNMKAMQRRDRGFFYHSVLEKRIMGIVEVIGTYRPDPSDGSGRFGLVDVKAVCSLPAPVTLAEIKANPRLAGMALLRQSRLSVQPVTDKEWTEICRMGGL